MAIWESAASEFTGRRPALKSCRRTVTWKYSIMAATYCPHELAGMEVFACGTAYRSGVTCNAV